jgi:hypothetical protein
MSALLTSFSADGQKRTVSYLSYDYQWLPHVGPSSSTSASANFRGHRQRVKVSIEICSITRDLDACASEKFTLNQCLFFYPDLYILLVSLVLCARAPRLGLPRAA